MNTYGMGHGAKAGYGTKGSRRATAIVEHARKIVALQRSRGSQAMMAARFNPKTKSCDAIPRDSDAPRNSHDRRRRLVTPERVSQ